MRHSRLSTLLAAVILALPSLTAGEGGVALGPALILLREVQPGSTVRLSQLTPAKYQVANNTNATVTVEVAATTPDPTQPVAWEAGFEAPAIPGLVALERNGTVAASHVVEIEAGRSAEFDLVLSLPARADLANRHFIAYIEAGQPSAVALGARLRLRARALIETAPADPGTEATSGALVWEPSRVDLRQQPDGSWTGATRLASAEAEERQVDLLPLSAVYPEAEAEKRTRFYQGDGASVGQPWADPQPRSLRVAAGRPALLQISARPGGTPDANGVREEVWFACRRAVEGSTRKPARSVDGVDYDRIELLRLRAAPAAPKVPSSAPEGSRP
jgi:hypothetical protein